MEEQKNMNWNDYEELKVGTVHTSTIAHIYLSVLGMLKSAEYFEKVDDPEALKQMPALKLVTDNNAVLVIAMPKNKRIHPNSKLAAFKKTYGSFPMLDMKVATMLDENGFYKIVL